MSALRVIAVLFGLVVIAAGILGFGVVPDLMKDNLLFGIFMVDPLHNAVHLVTGVLALIAAMMSERASRVFFQIFGIVYLIVAIVGFWRNGDLYFMTVNMPDNYLHLGIAIFSLYFGFIFRRV